MDRFCLHDAVCRISPKHGSQRRKGEVTVLTFYDMLWDKGVLVCTVFPEEEG